MSIPAIDKFAKTGFDKSKTEKIKSRVFIDSVFIICQIVKMPTKIVYIILKWFFALLVIATGIGKLLDNRGFAEVILTYQFGLPLTMALILGLGVSLFELFLGIFIILEKNQVRNGLLLILMHFGYVALATVSNIRGLNLQNCGCFGVFWGRPLTWWTVVEDLILLAASILFYRLCVKFSKTKEL